MRQTLIVLCAFSALTNMRANAGNFTRGDVLLGFIAGSPKLQRYNGVGLLLQSFDGTGAPWLGATPFSNTKVITTRRLPVPGINIFDSNGNEFTFDISSEVLPGDVSVFSDGTLAISDQYGRVVLYSQGGAFLGEIDNPSFVIDFIFDSTIDSHDTLWIPIQNEVYRLTRDGELLGTTTLPFNVSRAITVDSADGTFWVPDSQRTLHNFSTDGTELSSFATAVVPPFIDSLALAPDRTLYVSSLFSTAVYRYSRDGNLIDSFPIASSGRPIFMSIVLVPEPRSAFQFAIIALALLDSRLLRYSCQTRTPLN